jgi:anti-sigma factor RsiW
MDCARARFLLYAHLDRDLSRLEAEALSRHLARCHPCAARGQSARGLANLLRSRLHPETAPPTLLRRLQAGPAAPLPRPRSPLWALAAAVGLLILPLAADVTVRRPSAPIASMGMVPSVGSVEPARVPDARRMTGVFVCFRCEARAESDLAPESHALHEPGFCAENGEAWRLMSRDSAAFGAASSGQTVTLEGVVFPQSGFLRAHRVGY